jgi:hypothetical protein
MVGAIKAGYGCSIPPSTMSLLMLHELTQLRDPGLR